jgi:uncharacterized protein YdaT
MKNLDPKVRRKAIGIANAVLEKTGDEGKAISIGISQAKSAGGSIAEDHQQSIRELTMGQADETIPDTQSPQQRVPHPTGGTRAFAPGPQASKKASAYDPEIQIQGFGIMLLSQAKAHALSYLRDAEAKAVTDKNDADSANCWKNVAYYAFSNGVLKALIEAVIRAEEKRPASTTLDSPP